MDASPEQLPPQLRYDGEDRRCSHGQYPSVERRRIDPATEQDHPEEFGCTEPEES